MLCRVHRPLHSANITDLPSAMARHSAKVACLPSVLPVALGTVATFAECLSQWRSAKRRPLPSVWPWHSAKPPSRWRSPSWRLFFAECQISTRQRGLCRSTVYRAPFAECNTRQTICRVYIGLCRVPEALGKEAVSSSELLGDIKGQTEQLRVICIVGFGGSGKSTLADAVY